MQCLAVKLQFPQYLVVWLSRTTVDRIAKQWVTDRSHVDANLVGAAGFEPAFDEGGVAQEAQSSPASYCPLAALALNDCDLLSVRRRARERRVHNPLGALRYPFDDRQVAAVDRVGSELFGE